MKITVMSEQEAKSLFRPKQGRGSCSEIYDRVDALEKGNVLVLEFDTAREAQSTASALSSMRQKGHRLDGCYVSLTGKVILIGKN